MFGFAGIWVWWWSHGVAMTEAELELLAEVDLAAGRLVRALDVLEGEDVVAAAVSIMKERLVLAGWTKEDPIEPSEPLDRKPAVYYAPRGECEYCDRRRAAAAKSMRAVREREG
jgi:hypothetical protein